jgi:uncharacterized protein YndB with AHSA1/START domain
MTDVVSVEREIEAPPERVWDLVSDVTRMGEWSPEAVGGVWIGGATGPAPGARFRGRNRSGRRRWSTRCTVVEADRGRSFVFQVKAGVLGVAEWAYRIDPTARGCRVTDTWTDRRGRIITWLGTIVSGVHDRVTHNRETMTRTLDGLASSAEGAATPA